MKDNAENELERLKGIIEASQMGTWDWDIVENYCHFNDYWSRLLGYEPHEIAPSTESWRKLLHPEDIAEVEKTLEANLGGETDFYDSFHRLMTKEGNYHWVHARGQVVARSTNGEPLRHRGTSHLVESYKQKELAEKKMTALNTYKATVVTYNHKINNCLNIIQGTIERFLDKDAEPELLRIALEKVEESVRILQEMDKIAEAKDMEFADYYSGMKMIDIAKDS